MELKILDKKELLNFVNAVAAEARVLAPVRQEDGVCFAPVTSAAQVCFDALNTRKSVKEQFFPQREQLFIYKGDEIREPSFDGAQSVIFGVRPCDARSMALLDNVFQSPEYQDPYYLSKRGNTVVVAMGCTKPETTCFCTSTGGDPCGTDGVDVLMIDTGDAYLMQPLTDRGDKLLSGKSQLKKAEKSHAEAKEKALAAARSAMKQQVQPREVKKKLDANFESPLWAQLHEKCLGCGICTFLCPTCHCFDILDETTGAAGERIRIWDSCMFPLFTLHASGSNPRSSGKERVRQRVMHKFKYFVDNFGAAACTGCGRCIRYCPVNLDIRQVLNQIQNQT